MPIGRYAVMQSCPMRLYIVKCLHPDVFIDYYIHKFYAKFNRNVPDTAIDRKYLYNRITRETCFRPMVVAHARFTFTGHPFTF
jgi:hypothetical protein